jgi:hypothetical protein
MLPWYESVRTARIRRMETPTPLSYFEALQDILRLQTEVLTRVLPHSGERGSNDEEHFKAFLRRILPRRYSLGTGFMISSNRHIQPSGQTDIVVFDEFHNSPLFRELAASVFPIEIVYAAIEVKRVLQSKDIPHCLDAIARIRRLAKEKQYVRYGGVKMSGEEKRQVIVEEYRRRLRRGRSSSPTTRTLEASNHFKMRGRRRCRGIRMLICMGVSS